MSNEDLLAKIGQTTEDTEFYTPTPPGYRKGHHKYVIVVGTVMSGLGKGIFSSSLAKLLQDKGFLRRGVIILPLYIICAMGLIWLAIQMVPSSATRRHTTLRARGRPCQSTVARVA